MWVSGLEHHPVHQKVVGSIPGQGTYRLHVRSQVQVYVGGNPLMFLTWTFLSLSNQ